MRGISPEKEETLQKRMRSLGVKEDDLDESFIRSSGPGGQNVNKVATCVQLHHHPSGISVKCQETRSQHLNRFRARELLLDELEERRNRARQKKIQEKEKQRRRKRKRSRKAKEKMLEEKKQRSRVKARRRPIRPKDVEE